MYCMCLNPTHRVANKLVSLSLSLSLLSVLLSLPGGCRGRTAAEVRISEKPIMAYPQTPLLCVQTYCRFPCRHFQIAAPCRARTTGPVSGSSPCAVATISGLTMALTGGSGSRIYSSCCIAATSPPLAPTRER